MSSGLKCRNCGSNEIEEDNARGDRVCTNCGSVLEDSLIVSEVQFEEVGHGASAIGQFVSAESTGGATNYGKFQVGSGTESREVTIKKAKKEITHLCHQLQLTQHYIDTALNFFKMALMRHLTRGRKSTHIYAACVYMTCRTEGTSHLLIDISDVQQICSYELGRTYLKLSHALCINVPSVDPCLYIMRFANRLQLGPKTHEVSMTALRIVQRMKKDSIHSGRRPTGLCGAALLIAARMHDFSRTIVDIVGVVKIHESTLRKRLSEFADTPSSGLTLEEFMTVDLEREQDPPSFKAARKKDRERIKEIGEHELTELQKEIDAYLEKDLDKATNALLKRYMGDLPSGQKSETTGADEEVVDDVVEAADSANFIEQSNLAAIKECLNDEQNSTKTNASGSTATAVHQKVIIEGLRPDIEAICRVTQSDLEHVEREKKSVVDDLFFDDMDDAELDQYVLTQDEADTKDTLWNALNAEYLQQRKEREERLAKEREEGKPEKKKRKPRKKIIGPSSTAGEAIEKMLQEKKISSKINYDILRTLTEGVVSQKTEASGSSNATLTITGEEVNLEEMPVILEDGPIKLKNGRTKAAYAVGGASAKRPKMEIGLPVVDETPKEEAVLVENDDIDEEEAGIADDIDADADVDADADADADAEPEPEASLKDMLNQGADDDDFYGYDDDDAY